MEHMFTLTSYVQLREQFRSSMTPFLETSRESVPEQDRDQAVGSQASSRHPIEAPNSLALKDTNPGELVNLEDAFLAITEELNFDFPASHAPNYPWNSEALPARHSAQLSFARLSREIDFCSWAILIAARNEASIWV
jgi:hypothetical protein